MPPKRKYDSVAQEEVGFTQSFTDDEGMTTTWKAYLGTIAIPVDNLETDSYRNRERDEDHITRLVQTFAMGARRFTRDTRMKAIMTKDNYDEVLTKYANEMCDTQILHLDSVRSMATQSEGSSLSDFIYVREWPADCPYAALIQGQHRRKALQSILAEQTRAATQGGQTSDGEPVKPPSSESYFWAVDLYDRDTLDSKSLASLRANRDDIYKKDTDGYNLLKMIEARQYMGEEEWEALLRPKTFGRWIETLYGIQSSQVHRVLSVVSSEFWFETWGKYVANKYGQAVFNFTAAEDFPFFFGISSMSMVVKRNEVRCKLPHGYPEGCTDIFCHNLEADIQHLNSCRGASFSAEGWGHLPSNNN